jgi:hypothetical protein
MHSRRANSSSALNRWHDSAASALYPPSPKVRRSCWRLAKAAPLLAAAVVCLILIRATLPVVQITAGSTAPRNGLPESEHFFPGLFSKVSSHTAQCADHADKTIMCLLSLAQRKQSCPSHLCQEQAAQASTQPVAAAGQASTTTTPRRPRCGCLLTAQSASAASAESRLSGGTRAAAAAHCACWTRQGLSGVSWMV